MRYGASLATRRPPILPTLTFWLLAALVGAGACLLILLRAGRAARAPEGEDPALAVHRRQLEEIEALAARGVVAEGEAARARAEAGRRLLVAGDRRRAPARGESRWTRLATLAGVASAPLAALGLYLAIGSPGSGDAPHAARVRAWRAADPSTLEPGQLAAVLEGLTRERPGDVQAWLYLGQARLAGGDPYGAVRAFSRATELAPQSAIGWEGLGEAFAAASQGRPGADAVRAWREALRHDPRSTSARFGLGRAREASGDPAGAAAIWRTAAGELPAGDPGRAALEGEIARVEGRAAAPAAVVDPAIRGMVAGLAARLERVPDDPAGWARLVRSYRVLGDEAAAEAALARARAVFAGRAEALAVVEGEGASVR